jgi:hypothetical protein
MLISHRLPLDVFPVSVCGCRNTLIQILEFVL